MSDAAASRLPVAIAVEGREAVVVGGDFFGVRIAQLLTHFGAHVVVVAGSDSGARENAAPAGIEFRRRGYVRGDLADAFIAVCTVADAEVRLAARAEADNVGCLLYVAGAPHLSDFIIEADESEHPRSEGES